MQLNKDHHGWHTLPTPKRPAFFVPSSNLKPSLTDHLKSEIEKSDKIIRDAGDLAIEEVERLALKYLKEHPELLKFEMGMGGWTFWDNDENSFHPSYTTNMDCSKLQCFIERWDQVLKITGAPITVHSPHHHA